jgi:hypothetical protein
MAIGKIFLGLVLAYVLLMGLGISEFRTQYQDGKFQNSALWYKPVGKGLVVGKDSLVNTIDLMKGSPAKASFFSTVFQVVLFGFALLFVSTMFFGLLEVGLAMPFNGVYSIGLTLLLLVVIGVGAYGFEALIGAVNPTGMAVGNLSDTVNQSVSNVVNAVNETVAASLI